MEKHNDRRIQPLIFSSSSDEYSSMTEDLCELSIVSKIRNYND